MSLLGNIRRALPSLSEAETQIANAARTVATKADALAHEVGGAIERVIRDTFEPITSPPVTGTFEQVPHAQLQLKADFRDSDKVAAIERSGGFETVSLANLPLDRTGPVGSDRGAHPAIPSTGMKHQDPVGFSFDSEDQATSEWLPQAVTTTADSDPKTGTYDGKKWLAVTWHKDTGDRARISFVDGDSVNGGGPARYTNVELMVPGADGKLAPLASHVGGVSWVGHSLYVAQTGGGVRVFDVDHLLKVQDPSKVPEGTSPYVLPQVGYYRVQAAPGEKPHAGSGSSPLFSGLSIDHTRNTPALLSQEYDDAHPGGRIVRWPIDPSTGKLQETSGTVQATDAWSVPLERLAGIARLKDGFRVATMGSPSGLWEMRDGQTPKRVDDLAKGIQQFSYDPTRNQIWTVAEHPGHRMVWRFDP